MNTKEYIDTLKNKPRNVRHRFALGFSLCVSVLIFSVWILAEFRVVPLLQGVNYNSPEYKAAYKKSTPFAMIGDSIDGIKSEFSKFSNQLDDNSKKVDELKQAQKQAAEKNILDETGNPKSETNLIIGSPPSPTDVYPDSVEVKTSSEDNSPNQNQPPETYDSVNTSLDNNDPIPPKVDPVQKNSPAYVDTSTIEPDNL